MYDKSIIKNGYRSIEKIAFKIHWTTIQRKYNVKKRLHSILKKLHSSGYVDDHGKSGDVYSLSDMGVAFVNGLENNK